MCKIREILECPDCKKHGHFGNTRYSPQSGWGRHFPKMTFAGQDRKYSDQTGH